MAYTYHFARPSVTTTIVFINPNTNKIMVGIRTRDNEVYPSMPCNMGGFLDPRINHKDFAENYGKDGENPVVRAGETAEECGIREAMEEFNIALEEQELILFHVGSSDKHDPRAHVVNICYYVTLSDRRWDEAVAGDDIEGLTEYDIKEFLERPVRMAFNHTDLVLKGLAAWQKEQHYQQLLLLEQRVSDLNWSLNADRQGGA